MNQGSSSHPDGGSASRRIESWAFGIVALLVFLLPLAFIPGAYANQAAIKGYLVVIGVLAAAILYLVSRWKEGSFEWISHPLSWVGAVFGILLVASSVAGGTFMKSFFGYGYEYSTAAFLVVLGLVAGLVALFSSRNASRAYVLYGSLTGAFVLAALYQALKLIRPGFLSFGGAFASATSTPVGSWYDLGTMAAAVFIVGSLTVVYAPLSRRWKAVALAISVVAAFFVVLTGLPLIWAGLALVFLALASYQYWNERKGAAFGKRLPLFALIAFVVAALFAWKGDIVTTPLVNALGAGYSELHLPWQMTLDIGDGAIKASPLLGSGSNTFGQDYLLYKPAVINQSPYWSVEFKSGFGFAPTLAITLGLAGFVLICLAYVYFVRAGVMALRAPRPKDPLRAYLQCSSFFAAAFFAVMALAYEVSYTSLFFAFVFLGIFIGSRVAANGGSALVPFSFGKRSALYGRSLAGVLLLVLAAGFIWYGARAVAFAYFEKGVGAVSVPASPDLAAAKADFLKAVAIDRTDTYYQALSQVDLQSASVLAGKLSSAQSAGSSTNEDDVKALSGLITEAASYAAAAVAVDPSNYYNYLAQAQVYGAAASLQVSGAYAAAVTAYQNAIKDNPSDPALYFDLAQLAAGQSKYDDATGYIGSALQLKGNYTDAVYLLSQIQVAQGKTADAITSVKFAVQLDPSDPTAYFQLGLLQYNASDYSDAVTSLAKAVSLSPTYANAQYFLGLSYSKIGDTENAIAQFQALAKSNPDNADVASILANLEAGTAPFANQTPPVSTPEKRSSPPISDQSGSADDASSSDAGQ